jgi:hypothetical protein
MKTLIFLLAFISATWPALGAITNSDRANIQATNRLSNGGFENGLSGWVTSGTAAGVTFGLDTTNFTDGLASFTFTKTGSASGSFIVTKDQATTAQLTGRNFEVTCQVENPFTPSGTPDQLCGRVNGVSTNCVTLPVGAGFQTVTTTIQPVTGDSFGAQVVWGNPSAGTGKIDECYVGPSRNIGTVQQARFLGSVAISGCAGGWVSTSTSFAAFPVQTTCVYTTEGLASPPATMLPAITVPSQGPGSYWLSYEGTIQTTSAGSSSSYQFTDGTTAAKEVSFLSNGSNGTSSTTISQHITYTSAPPSSITFQIFGKQSSGSVIVNGTTANPGVIKVYYFPTSAQSVVAANQQTQPTVTKLLSGSGTYATPAGVTRLEIEMVGGGGGGSGAGAGAGAGITGGNTTFGTSLLVANGGVGGPFSSYGGVGGTASLGTGPIGIALQGGAGAGTSVGSATNIGGQGASSPFGGTGSTVAGAAGLAAIPNTGAGGSGGGGGNGINSGAGGGAGGYVKAVITNPSATYTYSVGGSGAGGTAGTSGTAGGASGSGAIYITEYYQGQNAPILTNSITTNAAGAWRHEFGYVTNNGSTCVASGGTNFMTASRSGTGTCVITFNSAFSGNSICESNQDLAGASGICNAYSDSATGTNVNCTNNGFGSADRNFKLTCDGPR